MGQVQLKHMQNACGACVPFRPLRAQLHLSSICEHRGVRKRLHTQKMPSSAVLRGAIRMRNHDHPPAEKLTHPHTRRIPLHREVEHRSAKRSSAGAPSWSPQHQCCGSGFRGPGAAARPRPTGTCAAPRGGEFLTMYPVSGDGPKSSQTVHRELTFGTSGELLCLVAGQDINRT